MDLRKTPSGQTLLLVWRTEFLFYTPEKTRLAQEWNHVRLSSAGTGVPEGAMDHSLKGPLPHGRETFDHIYSFHVIEHLSFENGRRFVRDLHRLLKPGGTCRISTPDLAFLAEEYLLRYRAQLAEPSKMNRARYGWSLYNLIDQCVREISGGQMIKAIRSGDYDADHVKHVTGDLLEFLGRLDPLPKASLSRAERFRRDPWGFLQRIPRAIRRRLAPQSARRTFFDQTHERNLWLYDQVSLAELFASAGFHDITVMDHRTSSIPEWSRYDYDQSSHGPYPLEPSLYMEAVK